MNQLNEPDADLAMLFEGIEAAQRDVHLPGRPPELSAMLETSTAATILARPSLNEQRERPN